MLSQVACIQELAESGWWGGERCAAFRAAVDETVAPPSATRYRRARWRAGETVCKTPFHSKKHNLEVYRKTHLEVVFVQLTRTLPSRP